MSDSKPRRWPRRLLKLFLWTTGSLVLLWTVTFALASWELNRVVAELKERGEPTTFAEAVAGNLEKAGSNRGRELVLQALKENERVGRPGDQLAMNLALYQMAIPAEEREGIATAINRGQSVVALMDRLEGASPAPLIDMLDVEFLQEADGIEYVHQSRSLGRLLSADARFSSATGDSRRTFRRVKTLYGLTEHLAGDMFVMPQLVRMAILGVAAGTLRNVLPIADFTIEELNQLDALLDGLERNYAVAPALVNQRAMDATIFLTPSALKKDLEVNATSRVPATTIPQRSWAAVDFVWCKLITSPLGIPIQRRAAAQSLSVPNEVLGLVDVPPPWSEASKKAFDEWKANFSSGRVSLNPASGNGPDLLVAAALRVRRTLTMMRLAVRLKRFHLQHGKLPTRLEELRDVAMPELPTKWFEKQPFIYTTKGDSFRIEAADAIAADMKRGAEDLQFAWGVLIKMDFPRKKK